MKPTLADETLVYFLAEAPGEHEDQISHRPLTGPLGLILRDCIPEGYEEFSSFDNVCNCSPPEGRTPDFAEIEACRPRRWDWISKAKPKLIVGLGLVPLQWMTGSSDMSAMRGRFFAVEVGGHACWFMPTYHPSHLLKFARDKKKPLNSMLGHCFRMDIKKAFLKADALPVPVIDTETDARKDIQCFDGTKSADFDRVLKLLDEAKKAFIKAVDLETRFLRPYTEGAGLMTAAISFGGTNFSFAVDHPKSGWSREQRDCILKAFKALLKDDTIKIAHNAPFEVEWLIWLLGMDVVNHTAWACSMMQAHFLDERRGARRDNDTGGSRYQSMDFLSKQYFGIAYKSIFKLNKKDMAKSDLGDTLIYNAVDTKYTLRLYHLQRKLLKELGLLKAYEDAVGRQPTVALMQSFGVLVDQQVVKKAQKQLGPEIERLEAEIAELPVIQQYAKDKGVFNPYSGSDVISVFRDYLKRKEVSVKQEGLEDKYSSNKNILDTIDHPLAEKIVELRNKAKMKSTYVDSLDLTPEDKKQALVIFPDGKLHTSFNTTTTETGRLSCVSHWTPVLTHRGIIPISEVCVGDKVWTHKSRWRNVIALWRKGWEQMVSIRFSNGEVLTCTKKHRLLLSTGEWKAVGDLHGFFEKMDTKSKQQRKSSGTVQKQRAYIDRRYSSFPEHESVKYISYSEVKSPPRGEKSLSFSKVLSIKDGGQKPYAGEVRKRSPQLEGRMLKWERLPNHKNRAKKNTCPSSCDYGSSEDKNSKRMARSSYRWKPNKQFDRQSSPCDPSGTQANTFEANGFSILEIEEIKVSGCFEVFDITVEEDESYLSCGVFSHNSSEPNLQNYPKRKDAWLRSMVIPPKGHLFVAVDYGQLEACTGAMCSKDKFLVKALWEDYDIHQEWAVRIATDCPALIGGRDKLSDKAEVKKFRSLIKNRMVFPAFFGASNGSVKDYLTSATDYDVSQHKVDDWMEAFWQAFSGVAAWQKATMTKYYDIGYVETLNGRRRHCPLTKNQAINQPVQGTAAELVCDAMTRLSYLALNTNQLHLHPILNVHDDLSFFIPDDDRLLEESLDIIKREMLVFDYPWINVPLSIEISVGSNWGDVQPLCKLWSHKDA